MAAEIHGEHLVEIFSGGLQQVAADGDADVIHEQVERGECASGGFDGSAALILDAHVCCDRVGATTFIANRLGGLLSELE